MAGTAPLVLCCLCGATMVSNASNMCASCLQANNDITRGVEKDVIVVQCRRCERWQKEDGTWIRCDPDSKELLGYCLRKLNGLKTVRLVDAAFVWTEPHSRRLKVKIKVQAEVERGVVLQQASVVEYVVRPQMCTDCHRGEAKMDWTAVVQVRQKVKHKRTFLFLEQLILKHRAQAKASRIEPMPDGVDFYFPSKNDAAMFVSFLDATVPVRFKMAEKLISADLKSNDSTYNFSYAVELAPVCKDDLVILPKQTAAHLGNISRLALCLHVASGMRFIDPFTGQFCELTSTAYWQKPFTPVLDAARLVPFIVLDVRRLEGASSSSRAAAAAAAATATSPTMGPTTSSTTTTAHKRRRKAQPVTAPGGSSRISTKHAMCEVEIAREKDLGANDDRHVVKCHLGFLLHPGDCVLGYDLTTANYNHGAEEGTFDFPDIVLVRKHYPKLRGKNRKRAWKLRSLAAEEPDKPGYGVGADPERHAQDLELFMRDLEEDPEMREHVQLYKADASATASQKAKAAASSSSSSSAGASGMEVVSSGAANGVGENEDEDEDEVEEDAPQIPLEELMESMALDDTAGAGGDGGAAAGDDDDDDESL